jgi:DNA-binding CsgD family transcriptional regulator
MVQRERIEAFHLSPVEVRIVDLAYQGLSQKEMTEKLKIQRSTLKTYVTRILLKSRAPRLSRAVYLWREYCGGALAQEGLLTAGEVRRSRGVPARASKRKA